MRSAFHAGWIRALLGLFLGLVSCGDNTSSAPSTEQFSSSGGGLSSSTLSPQDLGISRALDVRHVGIRLVTTADATLTIGQGMVQYLERMESDGTGRFALEPVGPFQPNQPPAGNWGTFYLVQFVRQGLFARYRDFEVRDAAAFTGEWSIQDRNSSVTVAGRSCRRVDVLQQGSERLFELSVDDETGLVLDQREIDSQGNLLLQVTYQSLDLAPDLSGVVWHVPTPTTPYDVDTDFESVLGADLRSPTVLPDGYELLGIELLDTEEKGDETGPWLMTTYTNGVDPLFFVANVSSAVEAHRDSTSGSSSSRKSSLVGSSAGTTMLTFSLGRSSAAVVDLPTGLVFAVGRVSIEELGDLIHSTIQ